MRQTETAKESRDDFTLKYKGHVGFLEMVIIE